MFDFDKWEEIWATVTRNKVRSFFTGFGVFWGIFMLVILLGLGNSLEGGLNKEIEGFATNSCFFWTNPTAEPYRGYRKGRMWTMRQNDIDDIKRKASALDYISPLIEISGAGKNIVYERKAQSCQIMGVYPEHYEVEAQYVLQGRLFNEMDISASRKTCIIGKKVSENFFGEQNAIGKYIRCNGIYFQVVGVIKPKSSASFGDVERTVYIPFTTMRQAFGMGDEIYFIACTVKKGYASELLENQVKTILKANHDISPDDRKAVQSFNIEKQFKIFDNIIVGTNILIWIVGVGSLLSGIVGIMNIMLVTVKERTREIGVRRAIGAKPRTILSQIMSESVVLTAMAGLSGLLAGVMLLEAVRWAMLTSPPEGLPFLPPFISMGKAVVALSILIIAGLIAGLLPAIRALQIKAIDAIRDE